MTKAKDLVQVLHVFAMNSFVLLGRTIIDVITSPGVLLPGSVHSILNALKILFHFFFSIADDRLLGRFKKTKYPYTY